MGPRCHFEPTNRRINVNSCSSDIDKHGLPSIVCHVLVVIQEMGLPVPATYSPYRCCSQIKTRPVSLQGAWTVGAEISQLPQPGTFCSGS